VLILASRNTADDAAGYLLRCGKPAARRCCILAVDIGAYVGTDRRTNGPTDAVPLHKRSQLETDSVNNEVDRRAGQQSENA